MTQIEYAGSLTTRKSDELRYAWALAIAATIVSFGWIALTDYTMTGLPLATYIAAVAMYLGSMHPLLERHGGIAAFLRGFAFLLFAWPALRLFNHLMMTLPFEYADESLSAIDNALGISWIGYLLWVDNHPWLVWLMDFCYDSLTPTSILVSIFILLSFGQARMFEFICLFAFTAVACSIIGAAFPAKAAAIFYEVRPEMFTHIDVLAGTYHIPFLEALRVDTHHNFHMIALPGLTTFPSFHTAMGILIIYCSRGKTVFSAVAYAYAVIMIAATPVFGSHYFIDLFAGLMVTLVVIAVYRRASPSVAANELQPTGNPSR